MAKPKKQRKFRPVPLRLRRMRYGAPYRADFRFYGLVETIRRRRKRISFQIKIPPSLLRARKGLAGLIRTTINNIKYGKKVPVHRPGDVFSSFGELFKARWIKIKRLLWYKAGVIYER